MTWLVAILALTQFIGLGVAQDLPCAPGRYVSICKVAGCGSTTTHVALWAFELLDNGRVCPAYPSRPGERGCELRCGKLRQKRDGTLRVRWREHCKTGRPPSELHTWQKFRGVLAGDCSVLSGRIIERSECEGRGCCGPHGCPSARYPVTLTRGFCGDGIVDISFKEPGTEECEPGVLLGYVNPDVSITPRECQDPDLACRPDCTCAAPQ